MIPYIYLHGLADDVITIDGPEEKKSQAKLLGFSHTPEHLHSSRS